MKKKFKEFLVIFLIIFFFFLFLLFLPSFFEIDNFYDNSDKIILQTTASTSLEQIRYDLIVENLLLVFKNISIQDANYKTLQHLLVTNQISNREHSLGEEILSLYLKNNSLASREVSKEIVDYILDQFDTEEQRKWRNHELNLYYNNSKLINLYNSSHLVLNFNSAQIKSRDYINLSTYKYQKYNFEFFNGTSEEILIDLNSHLDYLEILSPYLDSNGLPKKDIKNVNSSFIYSNITYQLEFKVWS